MALWVPVIWLLIIASRSVSVWLGLVSTNTPQSLLEGSPVDEFVLGSLLTAGIIVLIRRNRRTRVLFTKNWPILFYFFYCLVSILWSDFPGVAFRRWIKAVGDVVMVLVVVTDAKPLVALRRFLSRTSFILLPTSLLLIKYFGDLGRAYDPYGHQTITGVTTNKNILGVVTFVLSLGAMWRVLTLLRGKDQPNRSRHLLAQGTLLGIGIVLLLMADSVTSTTCFVLGSGLMVANDLHVLRRGPTSMHMLVFGLLMTGVAVFLGGENAVVHAMGRQSDLTGRTAIWDAVIPMSPNLMLGAGFESFWLGSRLDRMWHAFPVFQPNEAHNGYIEIYLNLGWVGLGLIGMILVTGYQHAAGLFRHDPATGSLMVAYIVAAAIYSISEAGFRSLNPMWVFLLLAIFSSGAVRRVGWPRLVNSNAGT